MQELPGLEKIITVSVEDAFDSHFFASRIFPEARTTGGLYVYGDYVGRNRDFTFYSFIRKLDVHLPDDFAPGSFRLSSSELWDSITNHATFMHVENSFQTRSLEYVGMINMQSTLWDYYVRNRVSKRV